MDYLKVKLQAVLQTQVNCWILLLMIFETHGEPRCGQIFSFSGINIPEEDFICAPLRTEEFSGFIGRLESRISNAVDTETFVSTLPETYTPPSEPGNPLCPTKLKQILGFWLHVSKGSLLCWVVRPHQQVILKAECDGSRCCGENTRCDLCAYVLVKYLVYCDAYYKDYDGCLVRTNLPSALLDSVDATEFEGADSGSGNGGRRDVDSFNFTSIDEASRDVDGNFQVLHDIEKRSCPESESFFAYRQDYFPSECTCQACEC